jgi:hypothetical protein
MRNFSFKLILLILLVICTIAACSDQRPKEEILFDFETDAELDRIHWQCFTMFTLSNEHVTHGSKSLRMELYPSNWPGLTPKLNVRNWKGFKAVSFDAYNPESSDIAITLRIDDREDFPDYDDRYNRSFVLKPGWNRIEVPFNSLMTSGTLRKMDLDNIYSFLFFMGNPDEKHVLYIDFIRLIRS